MITLRPVTNEDIALVGEWPAYPPDFYGLDYAIRENGWLTEYRKKLSTRCYIADEFGTPIGFSILSKTRTDEAEFRIALRGDKIGRGYGRVLSSETLTKGFTEMHLSKIHLAVQKNNQSAIHLYRKLGFTENTHCVYVVRGTPIVCIAMTLDKQSWLVRSGQTLHSSTYKH